MRPLRRTAIGVLIAAALLFVVLICAPILLGGRINAAVRNAVDGSVNARIAWADVGVSFLRDFPNLTVSLNGLSAVGAKPFEGDTLAAVRQARLIVGTASAVRFFTSGAPIVIRKLDLRDPRIHLRGLADGTANWDIARKSTAQAKGSAGVSVTLRDFRISNGSIFLDDKRTGLTASLVGIQDRLSGDFAKQHFGLTTNLRVDTASVRFAGVSYLNRVAIAVDADMDADLGAHRFTIRKNTVAVNRLALTAAGSVTTGNPDLGVDLTFSTPRTAFGDILSLVPAIYTHDFDRLETSGTMSVAGFVRGSYGPHAFPALSLRARVNNGAFKYPSLPASAHDVAMDLAVDNPGGHVDSTVVNLKAFHAAIGSRAIDARMLLRTPVSDPDADIQLAGTVDLADIGRTVKLDGVSQLAGQIAADLVLHARVSDVDARRYDRVVARGTLGVSHVAVKSATMPAVAVDTAALRFTPQNAQLSAFAATVGHSDVRATGALDNVVGFLFRDQDLRGSAAVSSNNFDLDEWRSQDKKTEVIPVPPHVDFALKASAARVTYGPLTLANVHGDLHVKDQRVTLDNLSMETLRGTMVATGFYETTVPDRPNFDVALKLTTVDIPAAFAALTTVQRLAPIAKWAQGSLSGTVSLKGALGPDMVPVFSALGGKGDIETQQLVLQGAPILERVANAFKVDSLRKPALGALRASFDIADGRLHVKPFVAKLGAMNLTVSGSNSVDQSIAYDLALTRGLAQLRAKIGGTISDPTVRSDLGGSLASTAQAAKDSIKQAGAARVDAAKAKADSAIAAAARQADSIRAQARAAVTTLKDEASRRADSLVAKATNPVARIAAQAAANKIRGAADEQAQRMIAAADARADSLVARAKQRSP